MRTQAAGYLAPSIFWSSIEGTDAKAEEQEPEALS